MNDEVKEVIVALMTWNVSLVTGKGYTTCKRAVYKAIAETFKEDPTITVDKIIGVMDRAKLDAS